MAQNNNITLSLGDKIDILNKTQSVDARYGVYDNESEALLSMDSYGLDGRLVAVYTDKINGKVKVYIYNQVLHQLDPIDDQSLALTIEQVRTNDNTVEGVILGSDEFDKQGDRTAFAQIADLEDAISEIPVITNDDNTLIIDGNIIRLNVTNITEEFIANGVDRNFEMTNVYTSIESVFINGVRIKSSDYITISEQEIEIKTTVTLLLGDEVVIQGTMFVVE